MHQATFYQTKTLTNTNKKKIILCLILTISTITASAQNSTLNIKADARDEFGIGAGLTIGINKHFTFNPAFIYFLNTGNTTYWAIDFDIHYNLNLTPKFKAYPIFGFAVFHEGERNGMGRSEWGTNIGLGCEYNFSERVSGFIEIKHQDIDKMGEESYASFGFKIGL